MVLEFTYAPTDVLDTSYEAKNNPMLAQSDRSC
jgi:hypothetical protein